MGVKEVAMKKLVLSFCLLALVQVSMAEDYLLDTSRMIVGSTIEKSLVVNYTCDGRVWCSEMTSCEEAKFFIRNCPGTKMDGDGDGIPCERQWCNN